MASRFDIGLEMTSASILSARIEELDMAIELIEEAPTYSAARDLRHRRAALKRALAEMERAGDARQQ